MAAIRLHSGWDKMSTASEEMVTATYAVPDASTLAALGNRQDWSDLSLAGLAEMIGGAWLKTGRSAA